MPAHMHNQQQGAHGGEVYRLAHALGCAPSDIIDFSSNANSLCDDLTGSILRGIEYPYSHYPDTWCTRLREQIARHEGVTPEEILVGNGSTENIYLTIQQLKPSRALLIGPIFSEYAKACDALGIPYELVACPSGNGFAPTGMDMQRISASKADIAILCTPNNPAGITYSDIGTFLRAIPCPAIMVDNTYREFLYGTPAYDENSIHAYRQAARPDCEIITVQSFTKFFYCTGVRLGYSVASSKITQQLAAGKMPWTVSTYAEEAGLTFLQYIGSYRSRLQDLRSNRAEFAEAMKITGVFQEGLIFEGVNFLCCGLQNPQQSMDLYNFLLQYRILVRVCDNIPGMPAGFIRMQVRERTRWEDLAASLEDFAVG